MKENTEEKRELEIQKVEWEEAQHWLYRSYFHVALQIKELTRMFFFISKYWYLKQSLYYEENRIFLQRFQYKQY